MLANVRTSVQSRGGSDSTPGPAPTAERRPPACLAWRFLRCRRYCECQERSRVGGGRLPASRLRSAASWHLIGLTSALERAPEEARVGASSESLARTPREARVDRGPTRGQVWCQPCVSGAGPTRGQGGCGSHERPGWVRVPREARVGAGPTRGQGAYLARGLPVRQARSAPLPLHAMQSLKPSSSHWQGAVPCHSWLSAAVGAWHTAQGEVLRQAAVRQECHRPGHLSVRCTPTTPCFVHRRLVEPQSRASKGGMHRESPNPQCEISSAHSYVCWEESPLLMQCLAPESRQSTSGAFPEQLQMYLFQEHSKSHVWKNIH
ncbi:hypothetical protein NDU88_000751 [Pleurodeles waltl]|uniref:Uncharacterized protein n=1 Tax=Pleurodeles waltl TaxID=8319 RepID=A0AAV7ND46_PLEWA|nr:hypothetical protein NDU88_000751 [Pleurodeles waltl]